MTANKLKTEEIYKVEDPVSISFAQVELSDWKCYMFGNKPGGSGIVWNPEVDHVPNAFVRWMMKVCFACTWVKEEK